MKNSIFVLLIVVSIVTSVAANDFTLRDDQFASISHLDADLDISVTDLNHDGLLDLFVVVEEDDDCRIERWEQDSDGSNEFTRTTNTFLTMSSLVMRTEFTDVDGDGLIDFFLGDYDWETGVSATIKHFEQTSANSDDFVLLNDRFNNIMISGNNCLAPVFIDLDNDGKLDLLVGLQDGTIRHYEANSVNSLNYSLVTATFNNIDIGEDVDLCIGDYNGDGLLDLVLGSFNHELIYYEQAQTGSYTFNHVNNSFLSTSMTPMKFSCFTDIDDDGYVDFLTGDHYDENNPSYIHRYEITPYVSTHDVSGITTSSAVVGVTTSANSALTYSDCGVCWSTSPTPTISDNVVSLGSGSGSFSTTLTGLDVYEIHRVRGYVQDQYGISYGEVESFTVIHDPMEFEGISCSQVTGQVYCNSQDQPILRVEVETSGIHDPLIFCELSGTTSGSTNYSHDIESVKMYYTGNDPEFSTDCPYGSAKIPNPYWEISEDMEMVEGMNYFWVCYDVSGDAVAGNILDGVLSYYWIYFVGYSNFPAGNPNGSREIVSLDNECGYALEFDGVNDMIEIADAPELEMGDVFTISAWIYPDDLDSRYGIFSTRATNQAGSFQLEVGPANGGTNRIAIAGSGPWVTITENHAIRPGEWNHIACSRSGSGMSECKIYVNGEEVPLSYEAAYTVLDNDDPIRIASGTNGGQLFNGKIDEVRLWKVARTRQEIRESMHLASAGSPNELVANWQFNEGSGATLDEQINNLTGTMVNMTDEDWVVSDIPFGGGETDTKTEENGGFYYGGTKIYANYSSQSGAEVTVTRLDNAPNTLPSMADNPFDNRYWIINRSDTGNFEATFTFYVNDDVTSELEANPQMLKLFTRPLNSTGEWSYLQTAEYANAAYDHVRFPNITQTGQFMVGVVDLPYIVSMDPQDNQPDAHLGGIVRMEFNRDMAAGTGNITLKRSSDDSVIAQIAASEAKFDGCEVLVDFNVMLDDNESYYVQIEPGALMDVAYASPFTGIDDDTTWNFTTGSYTPVLGTCIEFDGVDDYINLGHSPVLDLTDGITLECWVKPDEQTDWARIFSAPGTFTGKYGLSLSNSEGKVEACYRIEGGSSVYRKSFYPDITLNQWNHIAFAADNAGHGYLYINGVKMAAGANSSFGFTGEDLVLGAKQNNDYRFKGCLDEVRIWDYPRTQEQIAGNMCTPIDPLTPGLKCYLQMNEGVGDLATDIIGGNDGTLSNMSRSGWMDSTIPYGEGSFQRIDIGEVGSYAFDQTGIDVDITSFMMMAEDTLEVYCTRLEEAPNALPTGVDAVFDSQYWVIETWGDQMYQADITFHVGDEVTTADETSPEILALYWRSFGSDSDWVLHSRAIDASSADNTITFTGITSLSQFVIARNTNFPSPDGVPGYCLTFDGVDDYVELANEEAYDFTTHFTAECWFKPTSAEEYFYCGIFGKDWEVMFEADPTMTSFMFDGSFCNFADFTDYEKSYLDRWSHIAVTYEFSADTWNGTLSMYLNGELVATADGWDMVPDTSEPFFIGTDGNEYPTYFEGEIDQVRLWSVCRTQEEIREHIYNPVSGLEPGITAIIQLNEGTGMAVTDAINSMAGTLTNMDASDWVASTIPYGAGLSASAVETSGIVEFNGTGITLDYTSQTGADVTVSRIELAPDAHPDVANTTFDDLYWVVNRYGTGTFEANMTFTLDENMPVNDDMLLFARTDGDWQQIACASSVDILANTATFNDISEFGQFIVGRKIPPDNFIGNCLELDGTDDYIECGTDASISAFDELTLEAWINPVDASLNQKVLGKFDDWDNYVIMGIGSNHQYSQIAANGNVISFQTGTIPSGEWTHLAMTFSKGDGGANGTFRAYINGEEVFSQTDVPDESIDVINESFPLRIGVAPWDTNAFHFGGAIDEVRVWNCQLLSTEIRENMYLSLTGVEEGLVSYWQMNELNGLNLPDKVSANDGTLINMDDYGWIPSTLPFGPGASYSGIEAGGSIDFDGTDLIMDFSAHSGAEITVTRIDTTANIDPTEPDEVFAQPYWIVNRYGTGDFSADITLTIDGLTPDDEANPGQIALFTRASNADDVWLYLSDASAVFSAVGEATFDGIEETGQFMITRWVRSIDAPRNLAIEIAGLDVRISWDDVDGANSYKIYACDSIGGSFVDVTGSGSFELPTRANAAKKIELGRSVSSKKQVPNATRRSRKTWSMPFTGEMKFFYVLSSTETVE